MYQDISIEWQEQNPDLKQMSEQIQQIEFGLERLQRCLATEFKLLTFMTQTEQHVNKLYKNPEQFPLNRNTAFMTFDPSRAWLGNEADKESVENYINANVVQVDGKRAIATQGPLTNSFNNFWRMVDQYKTDSIFMLCNLIEKGKIKCDRYFPQKPPNDTLVEKEYTVTYLEEESMFKDRLKVRRLQVKNNQSEETRIITHYQVVDWQDGEVPSKGSLKHIRYVLDQFLNSLGNEGSPIVHCSAGVGRTGTFIAMAILKQQIANHQSLSIFNQVRKLREQRWGMVHTLSQYEYLYDFAEGEIDQLHNGIANLSSASSQQMKEEEGQMMII